MDGFGNLIALPLQKALCDHVCSVFVDCELRRQSVQWAYLASIQTMTRKDIVPTIFK